MQTLESILAGHPFFKGLEPQYLQLITGCASNTRFGVGDYMFREGEDASQFYLIREGKVALEIFAAQYGPITIETIEAGEVLGWSWIFPPYRWHFSGHVMEPTRAIALDGTCLRSKGEAISPHLPPGSSTCSTSLVRAKFQSRSAVTRPKEGRLCIRRELWEPCQEPCAN